MYIYGVLVWPGSSQELEMKELRFVDHNRLASLPEGFGNLSKLRFLNIERTRTGFKVGGSKWGVLAFGVLVWWILSSWVHIRPQIVGSSQVLVSG